MFIKTGPQTGISLEPCAGLPARPPIELATSSEGNLPLFLFERVVRSEGTYFQGAGGRSVTLTFFPVTRGAIGQLHLLA
jgi:hypothetical protein